MTCINKYDVNVFAVVLSHFNVNLDSNFEESSPNGASFKRSQ